MGAVMNELLDNRLLMPWAIPIPSDGLGLKEGQGMEDRRGQNDLNSINAFTFWTWDRSVTLARDAR